MQARSPVPNGLYACGERAASASGREAGGVEQLGVVAPDRVAVQHRGEHDDRLCPALQRDAAAEQGVLAGLAAEGGGRRPQPQRLVEDLAGVRQPPDVLERRARGRPGRPTARRPRAGPAERERVLEQVVEREGERARGGLVTGDQEGDDLVADVGGVEGGAVAPGCAAPSISPSRSSSPRLAARRPGGDDLVDDRGEIVGVGAEGRVRRRVVAVRGRGRAWSWLHSRQRTIASTNGCALVAAVEGLEVVAEPGQPDGVQRHPGHVVGRRRPGVPSRRAAGPRSR